MNKLATAALAAALLTGGSVDALAVERGGDLTFGRYADSLLLDPVWNDANVDIWIFTNLYDTLIRSSPDGKGLEPGLATEWTVSDDGTEVTLTLREGVKFADGSDMTAEDVKWSLDRARNPENGIWNGLIGSIGSVEIADPQTIVLKLKNPDPTIIPALAVFNTAIMPKALYEAEPGATDAGEGEVLRRAPDRHRTVRVRELGARHAHAHGAQPAPLGDGRGRRAPALSRFGDLRDHPGRRDPDLEAEVGRARRCRVHPVRPGRRARRRSATSTCSCFRRPGSPI